MSYHLYMLAPVEGEDPMETLERLAEDESPPPPEVLARNRRIADAVLAAHPGWTKTESDAGGWIELDDGEALQVGLSEHEASFNFPYWDSLDTDRILRDIGSAADAIARETGWKLYDPQIERFFDPARDRDAFRKAFGAGTDAVNRIRQEHADVEPPPPPWWKRLLGG
jgi:hypothetical protein